MWSNLSLTSKNLAHRLIHFKVIHRAYITPYKRFKMKLQSNSNCHTCNTASSGTFLHMFWECPVVISLWTHVNLVLSSLLRIDWSVNPSLCLLDDSGLCISRDGRRETDVSTRCRDPEAQMFRNIGACHKCFETCILADSVFDWQGREQITQLHICLNLTPTKSKSGVNASSLCGFLWEERYFAI